MLGGDFLWFIFPDPFHTQQHTLPASRWVLREGWLMDRRATFSPPGRITGHFSKELVFSQTPTSVGEEMELLIVKE